MKKVADIYVRVSTDEQANTGYSQRHQEEVLRRYCEINAITVRKVFFEDHSAKTFERPEWKKMLAEYKKHKGLIDLILFLKWDRFSRNAGDSYGMIATLNKMGIEPQAVEQPLDLTVPENKMMLAFYLAAPEVENARRALNVTHGMRRARKEGRFMGVAPIGYANKVYETGRKYIAPKEPEASMVRWAFHELASARQPVEELWLQAKEKGFSCSKNNFWHMIQNPIYCGKIMVPKYQQEESYLVQGTHEPLITEELFYTAQDVLHGRRRHTAVKQAVRPEFPLRNFLICPKCGKQITASASKGRSEYYSYYHCTAACGWRYKAEQLHDAFIAELRTYKPKEGMVVLYKQVILDVYNNQVAGKQLEKKEIIRHINELNNRLVKSRELLLADTLDASDYKAIKTECERKLNLLEAQLSSADTKEERIDSLLDKALYNLAHIDERYEAADVNGKRQIIGSIFPDKLRFENNAYRTARLNEAVAMIYKLGAAFAEKKMGQTSDFTSLSHEVNLIELESRMIENE